jgi:predicted flap endonuclease-1-like 5' DNA nuclease
MRSVRSEAFRAPDSMAAAPSAEPDDLKRIRGIGLLIERKLNAMGVSTYEQIANWTADDVSTVNAKLEFKGRIERENWIEQARILASGGHTDFSRRFERGEV